MALTNWVAERLSGKSEVADVEIDGDLVRIARHHRPPLTIAPTSQERVTVDDVERIFASDTLDAIVVVPKGSHYDWAARQRAEELLGTVLTFGELLTALPMQRPHEARDRATAYAQRAIRNNRAVTRVEMLCERSMKVHRHDLPPLTVAVDEQYEFTEEALITALERHPDVDIIYDNNPNGRVTEAAVTYGRHAGVEVFKLPALMSRLWAP